MRAMCVYMHACHITAAANCCTTETSVSVLQPVMHPQEMRHQAGVVGPEGLPGMGRQLLEMGRRGALVLLLGILEMTRMHPPGGMLLLLSDEEMLLLQPEAVLGGRQTQCRQCVYAGWVFCLLAVVLALTCTIDCYIEQMDLLA